MMKLLPIFLVFFLSHPVRAQHSTEEADLRKTIEMFFEGFHRQDSLKIKSVTSENVIMQSIGKGKDGGTELHQNDFSDFLKAIVSIPEEKEFREELHSFSIQVDGDMANVWTPYSFFFDGEFSHCGVNNFQLMRVKEKWKIFYLVDTRRKDGCDG